MSTRTEQHHDEQHHDEHKSVGMGGKLAFAWAVVGIPLAMAGALSPVVAGAAMALSSVSVLTNALLLRRTIEKGRPEQP